MSATRHAETSQRPNPFSPLPENPVLRGLLAFPFVFLLFLLINFKYIGFPYFWDGLGYVFPHAHDIHAAHLFPILTRWDVGHPTLYTWLLAAVMKVVGIGPLAGKIVSWSFGSLLVIATYGCARVLRLSHLQAVAVTLPVCALPLMRVNFLLTNLDLALAALAVASWWAWCRGRFGAYFLFASAMVLTKIYGVILLLPIALAALVYPRGIWSDMRPAARRFLLAMSPMSILLLFVGVRHVVRGGGLTLGWETGNQPVPIWRLGAWLDYLPTALDELFVASMLHIFLLLIVVVGFAWLFAAPLWGREKWAHDPAAMQLLLIMGGTFAILTLFFTQSLSLTARYMMPAIPAIFLVMARIMADFFRGSAVPAALLFFLALGLTFHSHPSRAEGLPGPLRQLLTPPRLDTGWRLENDLRALDVVHVYREALALVDETAASLNVPPDITVSWPFNIALYDPRMGWADRVYNTHGANSWADAPIDTHPFVLVVNPVAWYGDEKPVGRVQLIGEFTRGDVSVQVYHATPGTSSP